MKTPLVRFAGLGLLLCAAADQALAQAPVNPNVPAPLASSQPVASAPVPFALKPYGIVKEVEKLTQSGTDIGVIKAFVQSWRTPYSISADDVLRLHEVGVPSDILTTLIQHQAEVAQAIVSANPNPAPVAPNPAAPYPGGAPQAGQNWTVPPPTPDQYSPQPTYPVDEGVYSYPAYPVYNYGYYYTYPGPYFYPGISVGLGFGFGGRGGFRGGYGGHGGGFGGRPGGGFGGHGGGFGGHGGGHR